MTFDTLKLNKSSFRGIPFYTDTTEQSGGQRTTIHNFINGGNEAESNGLKNNDFKLTAYLGGENYLEQKQNLIDAFNIIGPGQLVDKYYGVIEVIADTWTAKEARSKFGNVTIEITFVKAKNRISSQTLIVYNVDLTPNATTYFKSEFDNEMGAYINLSLIHI